MGQSMDTVFERLIFLPVEPVIDELATIPAFRNRLYTITKPIKYKGGMHDIGISDNSGLLVARSSGEEVREADEYCASHSNAGKEQLKIPVLRDYWMGDFNPYPHISNLLRFLASVSARNNTVAIYYRCLGSGGGTAWWFDASIFDYRTEMSAYSILEYYDQGSPTIGQYSGFTKFSEFQAQVINGYQGTVKLPPIDIPLIHFIRNYWEYEWRQELWERTSI